jgi:hypothetical protein
MGVAKSRSKTLWVANVSCSIFSIPTLQPPPPLECPLLPRTSCHHRTVGPLIFYERKKSPHPRSPTCPNVKYIWLSDLDSSRTLESSSDQDYSISSASSELRDAEGILSHSPIDSTSDKWSLRHNFYKNDAHDSIIIWREMVQLIGEYSFIKPVDNTKNVPLSR